MFLSFVTSRNGGFDHHLNVTDAPANDPNPVFSIFDGLTEAEREHLKDAHVYVDGGDSFETNIKPSIKKFKVKHFFDM